MQTILCCFIIYGTNDLHIYSIMQKHYVIYTHSIYTVVKYGIIMVSCKTYEYVFSSFMFLMQNASPLHPIVIDTLMNFQHRGQPSFIYSMNQKGIRNLQVTMNLVHFEFFGSRSLLNPKQEC